MARFVLVHGAFSGAWIWEPLERSLAAKGHQSVAFDLPGLGDDATPAADVSLESSAARVCSAFLPKDGQSLLALTQLPEGAGDQVQANIVVTDDPPVAVMPASASQEALYGCCTNEVTEWAIAHQSPQPLAPMGTPVSIPTAALDGISRYYVLCTRDQAIPPALQRRMIAENDCRAVFKLDTDHTPHLSRVNELAQILDEIARPVA